MLSWVKLTVAYQHLKCNTHSGSVTTASGHWCRKGPVNTDSETLLYRLYSCTICACLMFHSRTVHCISVKCVKLKLNSMV